MRFLDVDVKQPFASVSANVDEGSRVMIGSTESYTVHEATGLLCVENVVC